jgi:septal ring factor EnvC (AmiA/AmiB activator)
MLYPNKPILESLFIFALLLLPMTKAAANDLPQQVNQLQTKIMEADEKIATLALDQQRTTSTINTLQTRLNTANHEISDLKNEHHQLVATNAGIHRTANGHGR